MEIDYNKLINENYQIIETIIPNINSLELISFLAYYNSLQESAEYQDYRGDKNYFVSEIAANYCLKKNYVSDNNYDVFEKIENYFILQKALSSYGALRVSSNINNSNNLENNFEAIYSKFNAEIKTVKNPGHPIHHLDFSNKLLAPITDLIFSKYGFHIETSVAIREKLTSFLSLRLNNIRKQCNTEKNRISRELFKLKKGKKSKNLIYKDFDFTHLIKLEDNDLKKEIDLFFKIDFFDSIHKGWVFTSNELSSFLNIDITEIENFLNTFSLRFGELPEEFDITNSQKSLSKKPFIKLENSYLLTSTPLLVWCVDEYFEDDLKLDNKFFSKYTKLKHDFLLETAESYFRTLLPNSKFFSNMFYGPKDHVCETDGLLIFNEYLFIIEAKANKLSTKSKEGHKSKLKDHLDDIIKGSHNQAIRTLNYINDNDVVIFKDKKGNSVDINKNNFKNIFLISLTLEQFGSLSPLFKNNDNQDIIDNSFFPWIVSLYDLVIIKDLFQLPSLLFKYLEFRNEYLKYNHTYVFEELDLIGYFLKGNSYKLLDILKNKDYNYFFFSPETDFINNYYQKIQLKEERVIKPNYFNNIAFEELISKIDNSNLNDSIDLSLHLLEYSSKSIHDLSNKYSTAIKLFKNDNKLHRCSIFSLDNIGFTYMIDKDLENLNETLVDYILNLKLKLNARNWYGIGELNNKIVTLIKI